MTTYKDKDLSRFSVDLTVAQRMVAEDAAKGRDEGTSVLGAGIVIDYLPPRGRKLVHKILIDQPFQGNVGSHRACLRAIEFLRTGGLDCRWYDGRMD